MAVGQKHSLPTDEDSVLELEQKKLSSQTSELPSETSGKSGNKVASLKPLKLGKMGRC